MADFDTSEFYIDTTYNFENVKKAINDRVEVDDANGGLDFPGTGSLDGGGLDSDADGGFFMGYIDGLASFFIGSFDSDYLHYGASSQDITARFTSLEMQGPLLGPSVMTIDPAGHDADTGTLLVRGTLQVGNSNNANIVPGGKATFTEFSILNLADDEVAYCNTQGTFYGNQFSTDNGYLDQSGVFNGTQLTLTNASIDALGAVTGTGLNIGTGKFTVDSAGDVYTATEVNVCDTVTLDCTGLTIGSTTIDSSGNIQVGPANTGVYLGVDGTLDINMALDEIDDVTITSPQGSEVLQYVAGTWVNSSLDWSEISNKPTFATVATSGSYNDLINKPTLFSGSYNDLTNKPTIPTTTSQLTNDSDFATETYVDNAVNAIQVGDTPAIYANNGLPYLKSDISAAEIRSLIGVDTLTWNNISGKPTTFTPSAHNQAWSTITGTPTTLSGYGITDAFSGSWNDLTDIPDPLPIDFEDIQNFPSTLSAAGLAATISDLTDVSDANATEGDVLTRLSDGTYGFVQRPLAYGVERETYTATAGQTTFNVDHGEAGKALVFVNGVAVDDSHWSSNAGLTAIVFSSGLTAGDVVQLVGYVERDEMEVVENLNDLLDVSTASSSVGQVLTKTASGYSFDWYDWSDLTGTPTTLAGYGITDAATSAQGALADSALQPGQVDNISELSNNVGYITSAGISLNKNSASSYDGGDLSYNNTSGLFTYRPADMTKANDAYSWGDHSVPGYAEPSDKISFFANVSTDTDDPNSSNPYVMMWDNNTNEWASELLEIDRLYGIPEPVTGDTDKVLTVSTTSNPQTYSWETPTDLPNVATSQTGTWTARTSDNDSSSYNSYTCYYAVSGKICHISGRIYNIDNDPNITSTHNFRITGLPFTPAADAFAPFRCDHIESTVVDRLHLAVYSGTSSIYLQYNNYSGTAAHLQWSAINDDDTDIWFGFSYRIA